MSKVVAVIGAMFGDEGKGLMTDYFTSQMPNSAVVRYNGGAQAGHTVQLPDGTRHVFSHFGSGTFNQRPTLLSEFFVVHPLMYVKELNELKSKGYEPIVYVHPECSVTTPYDMIINQIIENRRAEHRHGSVGVGFGETFEREAYMPLKVKELNGGNIQQLREKLILIRDRWVPSRIQTAQNDSEKEIYEALNSDGLLNDFMEKCQEMAAHVKILDYARFTHYNLVFEGAQGLMLDQTYGFFPHVTRSNTGCKNIFKILPHFDVEELKLVHVARAYTTRHGAGPMAFEQPFPEHIVDNTNHSHLFQGNLRYAPFNVDQIRNGIAEDLKEAGLYKQYTCKHEFALTCVDQIIDTWPFVYGNNIYSKDKSEVFNFADKVANYISTGPTRNDIKVIAR